MQQNKTYRNKCIAIMFNSGAQFFRIVGLESRGQRQIRFAIALR